MSKRHGISSSSGRHVVAAVENWFPSTIDMNSSVISPRLHELTSLTQRQGWYGSYIDLLDAFSRRANFTYTIARVADGAAGNRNRTTGKWSSLLGMVDDNQVQMMLEGITVTDERSQYFRYAKLPVRVSNFAFLMLRSHISTYNALDWFALFRPFSLDVWLALAVGVIGVIMLSCTFEMCLRNLGAEARRIQRRERRHAVGFKTAVYTGEQVVRAMTQQVHINFTPKKSYVKSWAAFVLLAFWLYFCAFFMALYPTDSFAQLVLPRKLKMPFNDLNSMRAAGFQLMSTHATMDGEALKRALNDTNNKEHKLIRDIILPPNEWPRDGDDFIHPMIMLRSSPQRRLVYLYGWGERLDKYQNYSACDLVAYQLDSKNSHQFRALTQYLPPSKFEHSVFAYNETVLRDEFDSFRYWASSFGLWQAAERKLLLWTQRKFSQTKPPVSAKMCSDNIMYGTTDYTRKKGSAVTSVKKGSKSHEPLSVQQLASASAMLMLGIGFATLVLALETLYSKIITLHWRRPLIGRCLK